MTCTKYFEVKKYTGILQMVGIMTKLFHKLNERHSKEILKMLRINHILEKIMEKTTILKDKWRMF